MSAELTPQAISAALDALWCKRIPRLDEIPPDRLIAEGIDPRTLLPYEKQDTTAADPVLGQ